MNEIDKLSWAVKGLEVFVIVFIVAVNIWIFGWVYPSVESVNCDFCTYEKDLALAMMFIVPLPSAFLIWALVNSHLDEHIEDLKENES